MIKILLALVFGLVILSCLILLALSGIFPAQIDSLINDFGSEIRVGFTRLAFGTLFLGLILPLLFLYEASKIHNKQESSKQELQENLKGLNDEIYELKSPTRVKLTVERYSEPKYRSTAVGVILQNDEKVDLTDIHIKLVSIHREGFDEELGEWEVVPIAMGTENLWFDLGEKRKAIARSGEPFRLAEIQGKEIVFLLENKTYKPAPPYMHNQGGYNYSRGQWKIEFDVYGKTPTNSLRERFATYINSTRIIPTYDDTVKDTISIGIGEIIPIQ